MEIRLKIKLVVLWKTIILLGIIVLLSACFHSKKEAVSSIAIIPDEHTLLAITPEFSIKMAGNTLNKHYLRLKSGKIFPMTGILQVDGRTYRFMGEDSLLSKAANTLNNLAPFIILLTNILSPSFNAGPIESDGILNDVKQNNCTKNKITIMQNIMNIKFSIIARNFFTLFICIL